jgi:beta-galactosidase/beta-glucuronidase
LTPPGHPRPTAARPHWARLDGVWHVELEPGADALPINVPWTFEAPLSGIGRGDEIHERPRYSRTFTVPRGWRGRRTLLHFGAVDWRATVYLDGKPVGGHEGGYTHFALDLGRLEADRAHTLTVDVEDPADGKQPRGKQRGSGGIWYSRATGIWQPVWIEAVPDAHIIDFAVAASLDGRIEIEVETSEPCDVRTRVHLGGELVAEGRTAAVVENPQRWDTTNPVLYDVELTTDAGDVVSTWTAFRSIERDGAEILLNGEPIRLAGVLDQGYWPDGVYTAPSDAALRADVEAAKAMGFNLVRKHMKVEDTRWYAWCDRLGMLVAQDLPSSHDLSTQEARDAFASEAEATVHQLRGHASVIAWILFNEDWGEPGPDFQRELVRRTRDADPTRLVVDASGWHQLDDTDVIDVHDYGDDLTRHASGDLPLWLGECGGISLPVPGHTWTADFAYKTVPDPETVVASYSRLIGPLGDVAGFVWTQLTDIEGEQNGLLTYDRVPKVPFPAIRAVNDTFTRRSPGGSAERT